MVTHLETSRAKSKKLAENGLCVSCGKERPPEGLRVCATCRKGIKEHNVARKARLISEGVCIICGKRPAISSHRQCKICAAVGADRRRKKVATLIASGICTDCGKQPPSKGSHICKECRARKVASQSRRRNERKAAGICVQCGKPVCSHSVQYCEYHWSIYNERSGESLFDGNRHIALDRDCYTCQICGRNYGRIEVHHLDLDPSHNDLANLITLCSKCHRAITHILSCASPSKVIQFVKVHYQV